MTGETITNLGGAAINESGALLHARPHSARGALDIRQQSPQNIRKFGEISFPLNHPTVDKFMTLSQPSQPPQKKVSPEQCKHPRVQIVSRDEESEYVECQECGDVFEASELKDMAVEDKNDPEEE